LVRVVDVVGGGEGWERDDGAGDESGYAAIDEETVGDVVVVDVVVVEEAIGGVGGGKGCTDRRRTIVCVADRFRRRTGGAWEGGVAVTEGGVDAAYYARVFADVERIVWIAGDTSACHRTTHH